MQVNLTIKSNGYTQSNDFLGILFFFFWGGHSEANIDTSVKLGPPRSGKGLSFFVMHEISHNNYSNRTTLGIRRYSYDVVTGR